MSLIVVSKAKLSDVAAIKNIQEVTWLATYVNDEYGITQEDIALQFSENNNGAGKTVVEKIKDYFSDKDILVLVAKENQSLVGFCVVKKHLDYNQIIKLYILPTAQRRGVGAKLINKALDWLDNKDVKLTVVAYNQPAINFYKKFGFEEEFNKQKPFPKNHLVSGKSLPLIRMRLTQQ